ncbi:hypothetical protein D3C85_1505480 [compost metagenome]
MLGVIRQVANPNPAWWFDHHITWAQRAIPVTAGIEIIHATVRHAVLTIREAVDHMPRPVLRARAPAIAVATRATLPLVIAIGRRCADVAIPVLIGVIASRLVLVVTTPRLLSLLHSVRSRLNRQVIGRQLRWRRG